MPDTEQPTTPTREALIAEIDALLTVSGEEEYVDTGDALDLLRRCREFLVSPPPARSVTRKDIVGRGGR